MNKNNSMMIIEDDHLMAALLTNSFSDNFKIRIANNYSEAKVVVGEFNPDVFIIDYFLPDATGITIYEELSTTFPDALYIVLSANESSENLLNLVKSGLRNYVVKDENAVQEIKKILKDELNLHV
jgi:DNA-binding NarL/FixJ family response regulator